MGQSTSQSIVDGYPLGRASQRHCAPRFGSQSAKEAQRGSQMSVLRQAAHWHLVALSSKHSALHA